MESRFERIPHRISRLAIASFTMAAVITILFLIVYFNPWGIGYYIDEIVPLNTNLAMLLVWLILPILGFVLGVKARRQCRYRSLAGGGWASAGIILSTVTGISLWLAVDSYSQVRVHYPYITCMSNLRQMATVAVMYAQDHHGTLPSQLSDLDPLMIPPNSAHVCPLFYGKESRGYGYNQALAGRNYSIVAQDISVVLMADSNNSDGLIRSRADIDDDRHIQGEPSSFYWHIGPMPKRKVFVACFLDGHVELKKEGASVRLKP